MLKLWNRAMSLPTDCLIRHETDALPETDEEAWSHSTFLKSFYEAIIVSAISIGITIWGAALTATSKSLRKIIKANKRIICDHNVLFLEDIHEKRSVQFAKKS